MDTLRDKHVLQEMWDKRQGAVEDLGPAAPRRPGRSGVTSLRGKRCAFF